MGRRRVVRQSHRSRGLLRRLHVLTNGLCLNMLLCRWLHLSGLRRPWVSPGGGIRGLALLLVDEEVAIVARMPHGCPPWRQCSVRPRPRASTKAPMRVARPPDRQQAPGGLTGGLPARSAKTSFDRYPLVAPAAPP
eukprot:15457160-Alexandrium_andersonii.AAC.1